MKYFFLANIGDVLKREGDFGGLKFNIKNTKYEACTIRFNKKFL